MPGRGVEAVRRGVGERRRVLLGAAVISLCCVSAELASQPALPPDVRPSPQPAPPASETPPAAPAPPAEAPAGAADIGKPLPTIAVTSGRPTQRAATANRTAKRGGPAGTPS